MDRNVKGEQSGSLAEFQVHSDYGSMFVEASKDKSGSTFGRTFDPNELTDLVLTLFLKY